MPPIGRLPRIKRTNKLVVSLQSFLAELLEKRAAVEITGASTGKNVRAALEEVDRQIKAVSYWRKLVDW